MFWLNPSVFEGPAPGLLAEYLCFCHNYPRGRGGSVLICYMSSILLLILWRSFLSAYISIWWNIDWNLKGLKSIRIRGDFVLHFLIRSWSWDSKTNKFTSCSAQYFKFQCIILWSAVSVSLMKKLWAFKQWLQCVGVPSQVSSAV